MGCLGIRVERPGDIQSALEQALAADRPAVVDVVSDINIVAPTPVIPD
jgi:acetolactate synthase-1/2/3 large subunit